MMIKTVEYLPGKNVAYAIQKNGMCIFTGLSAGPSTINAAEDIISAILSIEGDNAREFYDLQTCLGYPHSKRPGQYDYDLVTFELEGVRPTNINWIPADCPARVRKLFSSYIEGR